MTSTRWLVEISTHPRTGQLVLAIAQSSDGGMKCFDTLVKVSVSCMGFFFGGLLVPKKNPSGDFSKASFFDPGLFHEHPGT